MSEEEILKGFLAISDKVRPGYQEIRVNLKVEADIENASASANPVVLLCCPLIGLDACTRYVVAGAAAAGAAAGTYFFIKGNLKRNYEAPVERVWEATLQAVEELRLATESKRHDAFGGEIQGKMADGDSFKIELKRLGENQKVILTD